MKGKKLITAIIGIMLILCTGKFMFAQENLTSNTIEDFEDTKTLIQPVGQWYDSYSPGLEDNGMFINFGIGLGPSGSYNMGIPPISGSIDFKISEELPITLGASLIFSTWSWSSGISSYTVNVTYTNIGIAGRAMYHFNFAENLDTYAGLILGWVIQNASVSYGSGYTSTPSGTYSGNSFFLWGSGIGIRYFFTDSMGIYGELSYSGLQYLSAGLTLKM